MKANFKLKGLSKPKSMTCYTENEVIFWAKTTLTHERFNALFEYCEGNWATEKIAVVEHEGLFDDGTPINPVVIEIIES
jgi:hypothetical protein